MTDAALLALVDGVRRALTRVVYARLLLLACAVVLSVWLMADGTRLVLGRGLMAVAYRSDPALGVLWRVILLLVVLGVAMLVWLLGRHRTRDLTTVRAAMWIEERESNARPTSFALVTLIEALATLHPTGGAAQVADHAMRAVAGSVPLQASARALVAQADVLRAVQQWVRQQLLGPALFVMGAVCVVVTGVLVGTGGSALQGVSRSVPGMAGLDRRGEMPVPPLGAWQVRVEAPAYTRLAPQQLGDVQTVAAVSGSTVLLRGTGPLPAPVVVRMVGSAADTLAVRRREQLVLPTAVPNGWQVRTTAGDGPVTLHLSRGGGSRLLVIEGRPDSIPVVSLLEPARDSVFRTADGTLALTATVRDDLGLAMARFELIVSSGEGERFTARTVPLGVRRFAGERTATIRATMDMAALKLVAGDIVHLRAMARDAHPLSSREDGSSETRSFRIARESEYDSVAVEPAPPPEVDKSLLSQRMLLRLTAKLDSQRPALARQTVLVESMKIGRDQARLRQAVGDIVFQRLSGDASGEHAHTVGDGHDHGVEQQQGKLALSGSNAGGVLSEGDDSPIIAINQPLLEAYNAMWDAGRALEQGDPKAAIPPMRLALAAIERARAAERLYLRGKPPTVIVDVAKVRLAGKDTGVTNQRPAREALPPRDALRAARLVLAAQLVARDVLAARDSLAVLRVDALADAPAFAAAVGAVLDALRDRRDATDAFVRARRVLGGVVRGDGGIWSRGVPP
jgi:hypothetical protein